MLARTNESTLLSVSRSAIRRRTAAVMIAALSVATGGCEFYNLSKPPSRPEAGVLIAEDGTAYMALASCEDFLVSQIDLGYRPDDSSEIVALSYTFDPPAPRSQALGILDPDATIAGAAREFDQTQFDLAMRTVESDDFPRAYVWVKYTDQNGEPDTAGSAWSGSLKAPKSWNQATQLDNNAIAWKCDDEPAWDFSVVSR